MPAFDRCALAEGDRIFDGTAQLPDVPGPCIICECCHGRGRHPLDFLSAVQHVVADEVLHEQRDVLETLGKRRALNREHADAKKEVLPGEMDFVETSYVFPITHMVAPKDKALTCSECHAKNGRLTNLTSFELNGLFICLLNTIIESCKVTDQIHIQHLKLLQRRP